MFSWLSASFCRVSASVGAAVWASGGELLPVEGVLVPAGGSLVPAGGSLIPAGATLDAQPGATPRARHRTSSKGLAMGAARRGLAARGSAGGPGPSDGGERVPLLESEGAAQSAFSSRVQPSAAGRLARDSRGISLRCEQPNCVRAERAEGSRR